MASQSLEFSRVSALHETLAVAETGGSEGEGADSGAREIRTGARGGVPSTDLAW